MEKRYGKTKMNHDPQTLGYMGMVIPKHQMSNYHTHHNSECVVCAALDAKMVRVGAVIFCNGCVERVFKTDNPVKDERETYLKWLNKRKEK